MKISYAGLNREEKAVAAKAAGEAVSFVSSFSRMKPKTAHARMKFISGDRWGCRRGGKNAGGSMKVYGEADRMSAYVRMEKNRGPGELEGIAVHEFAHVNDTDSDALLSKARRNRRWAATHLKTVKGKLGFFARVLGKGKEEVKKARERAQMRGEGYCIALAVTEGWATLVEMGYCRKLGMEKEYREYVDVSITHAAETSGGGVQCFNKYLQGFNFYYQLETMFGRAAAYLLPRFFPPKKMEEINFPEIYYVGRLKDEMGEREFLRIVNRAAKVKFPK